MMTDYEAKIALSYSRLSDFEACPLKFKQKYIDKTFPDDSDNPAFVKGNAIHKQLEDYVLHKISSDVDAPKMSAWTKDAVPLIETLYKACNGNIFPEKQLAVNQDWERCTWFDKPNVVKYRAIIDFLGFLNETDLAVIDWKSGKVREYEDGPTTQLKLTAVILFSLYPKIQKITTCYVFVEHKRTVKVTFTRDQLEELRAPFDNSHKLVNTETEWKFKKNQFCHWCASEDCPIKK